MLKKAMVKTVTCLLLIISSLHLFSQRADSSHIYFSSGKMYSDHGSWQPLVQDSVLSDTSWGRPTRWVTYWGADSSTTGFDSLGMKIFFSWVRGGSTLYPDRKDTTFYYRDKQSRQVKYENDVIKSYQALDKDGTVIVEGAYENGKKQGAWIYYSKAKKLYTIEHYNDGILLKTEFKNGVKN